jgi:hypothetical protein
MIVMNSTRFFQLNSLKNMTGTSGTDITFTFTFTDLTGRQLRADRPQLKADRLNASTNDVTGVQPGNYFVNLSTAAVETVTNVFTSFLA